MLDKFLFISSPLIHNTKQLDKKIILLSFRVINYSIIDDKQVDSLDG